MDPLHPCPSLLTLGGTMASRQELEARCDELLNDREKTVRRYEQAKLDLDNLKDRTEDLLHLLMTKIDSEHEKEVSEARLRRLAKRTGEWRTHRDGVHAARVELMNAKIMLDQVRKAYELAYCRYMKS